MAAIALQGTISCQASFSGTVGGVAHALSGVIGSTVWVKGYLEPEYGSFKKETDHVGTGLDRLFGKLRDKPKLEGLLTAFLNQIQDLEDALWSILEGYNLYKAIGDQLDTIGAIVGEERQGLDDENYRSMLFVRILLNKCQANVEDILTIFERFYSQTQYELIQYPPAGLNLRIAGVMPSAPSPSRFFQVLQTAKGAGISATMTYQYVQESEVKKFDTAGQGFDSGKWPVTMV